MDIGISLWLHNTLPQCRHHHYHTSRTLFKAEGTKHQTQLHDSSNQVTRLRYTTEIKKTARTLQMCTSALDLGMTI